MKRKLELVEGGLYALRGQYFHVRAVGEQRFARFNLRRIVVYVSLRDVLTVEVIAEQDWLRTFKGARLVGRDLEYWKRRKRTGIVAYGFLLDEGVLCTVLQVGESLTIEKKRPRDVLAH